MTTDGAALAAAFLADIQNTAIPIIAEFAYQHGVSKSVLYDWEELADLLKLCSTKKEAALERAALENRINPSVAIFSLKQLGWSDRAEQTHKGVAVKPIGISENVTSQTAARL